MTVRFLIDAQLPAALAERLSAAGVPSVHVAELGLLSASDAQSWQKAIDLGATIVSKDQDFVEHAKRSPFGPQVVWLRLGNMRNEALWLRLAAVLDEIVAALDPGERVIEVE